MTLLVPAPPDPTLSASAPRPLARLAMCGHPPPADVSGGGTTRPHFASPEVHALAIFIRANRSAGLKETFHPQPETNNVSNQKNSVHQPRQRLSRTEQLTLNT